MATVVDEFIATFGVKPDSGSFSKAESLLQGLESKATAVAGILGAAFAGGKLVGFFKDLVAQGDALNDAVERTGIGATALQGLGLAAEQNGSSLEELVAGLGKLQIKSQEAAGGSKEAAKSFKELGISAAELKKGIPTEELLARVADAIADTADPAKQSALAMKAFGRAGVSLLPFLKQGRDGLAEVNKRFKELGGGLSADFVKIADEVNDKLAELHVVSQSLGSTLGVILIPVVTNIVTKMTGWALSIKGLLEGTQFLQSALVVGTAAFIAWGLASLWASETLRKKAGLIAALLAMAAALDEVNTAARGGKTLIGAWIDKWAGLGTIDRWVRSIGQGLQIIKQLLKDGDLRNIPDFKDIGNALDTTNRKAELQGRIDALKENIAKLESQQPTNDIDKQLRLNLLFRNRERLRETEAQQFGFQENVPRATDRGLAAGVEKVVAGRAGASAVNQGMAATLFGMEGKAVQNAAGRTEIIDQSVVVLPEINITTSSNSSARDIKQHVKEGVREAMDGVADQIKRTRGRRRQSASAQPVGGDASLDGADK